MGFSCVFSSVSPWFVPPKNHEWLLEVMSLPIEVSFEMPPGDDIDLQLSAALLFLSKSFFRKGGFPKFFSNCSTSPTLCKKKTKPTKKHQKSRDLKLKQLGCLPPNFFTVKKPTTFSPNEQKNSRLGFLDGLESGLPKGVVNQGPQRRRHGAWFLLEKKKTGQELRNVGTHEVEIVLFFFGLNICQKMRCKC